jgi:hypothetical protein
MHNCDLNGVWLEPEAGATLTLQENPHGVTGLWAGGRWHETLRGHFNGKACNGGYEGDYVNHEGVVTGVGRMRLEPIDHDTIRFFGHGDWSGGGASGHVDGHYILHRHR